MITAIIILSTILLISIYVNINLLRKNEDMVDKIMENDDIMYGVREKIKQTYNTIKTIDSKGAFEADDETGTVFEGIKESIKLLREDIDE